MHRKSQQINHIIQSYLRRDNTSCTKQRNRSQEIQFHGLIYFDRCNGIMSSSLQYLCLILSYSGCTLRDTRSLDVLFYQQIGIYFAFHSIFLVEHASILSLILVLCIPIYQQRVTSTNRGSKYGSAKQKDRLLISSREIKFPMVHELISAYVMH